ncbi:uncharacterized protein LOC106164907 [Lingula anatina]|uniref:Uncharacterized protein LOC106164907 n=1 Tax=Lingula anatina TaxID=7574 RepID=A0A1S3IKI9_LINAN|nr:uncharacterized protein LOC106164907 [Lingula anatina]|eukprot:XP_013398406.1 uncharacterized protein LOC106164907 [Lingula anatina]
MFKMKNQYSSAIFISTIILGLLVRRGAALNCYQCDSGSDPECTENFDYENPSGTLVATECTVADAKYCVKTTGVWAGVVGTTRFCSSRDMGTQCQYITFPDHERTYRACIHSCTTDSCNSAPGLKAGILFAGILSDFCQIA